MPNDAGNHADDTEVRNRIVSEIRLERLKQEIIEELEGSAAEAKRAKAHQRLSWIPKFFGHTAVLLIMGFLLTGVVGNALTSAWQDNSWIAQQSLLANQRILDRKYELATDLAKALGDTHAAPTMVLLLFTNEDTSQNRKNELPKRIENWRRAYEAWITNYNVLLQRITVYVRNPNAHQRFETIIGDRKRTNNDILLLLSEIAKPSDAPIGLEQDPTVDTAELESLRKTIGRMEKDFNERKGRTRQTRRGLKALQTLYRPLAANRVRLHISDALVHLISANEQSKQLMEIIRNEIREDSSPPRPSGFWSVLARIFIP
jgi:hypothetical protein